MLGTFFGFGGRLGRLQYLGYATLLGVGFWMLVGLSLLTALTSLSGSGGGKGGGLGAMLLPLVILVPLFGWSSLALQAKRIRDIGWNPAVVIPAWMVVTTVALFATLLAGATGKGHPSLLGMVNLPMTAVLLLWPGVERNSGFGSSYHEPEPLARHDHALPVARTPMVAKPVVRPASPPPVRGPGGFGRRGLS